MKKNALLIASLIVLLVSVAADRPPTKLWEYEFGFAVNNQNNVQDGRGGIAVRAGTNDSVFWFDSKGNPVIINAGSMWLIACAPSRLIVGVSSTNGGSHYSLRRYKRDGTFVESPDTFGSAMYPAVQPNDQLGFFVISADGNKLMRYRY